MTRRYRIAIFVCAGIVAAVGLVAILSMVLQPAEPSYQGKRLSEWLLELDERSLGEKREKAEHAVGQMGGKAVPLVIHYLNRRDSIFRQLLAEIFEGRFPFTPQEHYRHRALSALQTLGPIAKDAAPDLRKLLQDGVMPYPVALTIVRVDPDAVNSLGQSLSQTNTEVRKAAAWYLGELTNRATVAIPLLLKALKDSSTDVRREAAWSLGRISEQPNAVVPALAAALSDTNVALTISLLQAIRSYGTNGKAAVPVLEALVDAPNRPTARVYASVALREVDPSAAEKANLSTSKLLARLDNLHNEAKREAMAILRISEKDANLVIPAFSSCLADTNWQIRTIAIHLLASYGAKSKQALPALTRMLEDPQLEVRETATNSIKRIDPDFIAKLPK